MCCFVLGPRDTTSGEYERSPSNYQNPVFPFQVVADNGGQLHDWIKSGYTFEIQHAKHHGLEILSTSNICHFRGIYLC